MLIWVYADRSLLTLTRVEYGAFVQTERADQKWSGLPDQDYA